MEHFPAALLTLTLQQYDIDRGEVYKKAAIWLAQQHQSKRVDDILRHARAELSPQAMDDIIRACVDVFYAANDPKQAELFVSLLQVC